MASFVLGTCILYLALCAYLQITGGDGNTGILWHYVYPVMVYYIAGIHVGTIFAAILILMELFLMTFDGIFPFQVQYESIFKMRFMATMVVMSVFGAMLEYSRFKAQKKLRNLADKFHAASQTDELTGLANRRALKERLSDEVVRSERSKKDFVILMYDIDYFKRINDQYGHDIGDRALRHLATCLKQNLRGYDIPSRWGGEEFLVLLPETDPEKGVKVAERIRKSVAETPLKIETGEEIHLNLSCGGSSWMGCRDVEALIKKADDRLYTAKQRGRNRVVWEG
jgi:diguanylate cyclase (GGDEF)-like protein